MNKYEQLIEYIINEQEDKARELFHNIVVEKSRDIYESLMDEEQQVDEEEQMDETIDQYDQQGDLAQSIQQDETNGLGEDDEEMGDIEIGGDDEGDDFGGDMGGDDMGGELGAEGDVEGKFQDIKAAIDDLQAEFDKLMGGEEGEEDMGGEPSGEFGGDDMGSEEEPAFGESIEEVEEAVGSGSGASGSGKSGSGMMEAAKGSGASGSGKSGSGKSGSGKSGSGKAMTEAEMMREYVEKISAPSNTEGTPVGTGQGGDKASVNTANPVAGKNDMGGTASNIVSGKGADTSDRDGNSPKGKAGGFLKAATEIDVAKRNVNKPGGNKGAQNWYNTKAKAKDAEGSTTDGSLSVNKQSLEGGRK